MPDITYGSVCSGIEAATQAWHPLGMRAAWFAEIEPFPSAVLAHHYPDVPNHGDMTKLAALVLASKIPAPDVLGGDKAHALIGSAVRRLTPLECERLQGFPDGYTSIPWRGKPASECPDGPRYKAIGNSKAVTVVRWIGRHLQQQLKTSPHG